MTLRPASLDELSALVIDGAARRRALRIVGRGTWLRGGGSVAETAEHLHLGAFSDVVEYEPGDLTITVGAAMPIAELDALTAAHNQWCPLAPWGGDEGSVGATIATATAGPLSVALGFPRDLVLGLECVDGHGKILRPGGKVVKNVAGFDLVRLMTGSWGSLAVLTRVSLRLRARPAVDETWAIACDAAQASAAQRTLRQSVTPPIACEVLAAPLTLSDGSTVPSGLLVRIAGNAAFVAAAQRAVQEVGTARPVDASAWKTLRASAPFPAPRPPLSDAVRALNARVKAAFDPANVLNPGILG